MSINNGIQAGAKNRNYAINKNRRMVYYNIYMHRKTVRQLRNTEVSK